MQATSACAFQCAVTGRDLESVIGHGEGMCMMLTASCEGEDKMPGGSLLCIGRPAL